jgi:acyl-CoA synthetase (AMP-forming)/AMP-acid ligase II/acyl carrier protein
MTKRDQRGSSGRAGKSTGNPKFSCLGNLLAFYGRSACNSDAILAPGRLPMTYGTLWGWAKETVRGLRSFGVGRHDRVAVVLPAGPEAAAMMISVAAGAICVPLNPSFTADEWQRYFAELRVSALLTRPDVDTASRQVARALDTPIIDLPTSPINGPGPFSIIGQTKRDVSDECFASGADDAFILLTSGSTSRPKTVPLTHGSVCLSAYNVGAAIALTPQDRLLSILPLFHGHGLISGVLAALAVGSSAVCTPGFDVEAFFGWLAECRPTWYTAVPAIHQAILSAAAAHKKVVKRSSLRLIRSASSTLPPKVLCGLEAAFGVPVIDTFGMTEAATQIAANPLRRRKLGSVGRPAGAEIAILDGEGRRLPRGERGEIALRGPTITRGYDNDVAATRLAFHNGWFRTGDLGYLDADGYLFIVGRIKEVIHRGGQKVTPSEVEEVLLDHPDVVEAAVFPIPHKQLVADVAAAIVLRPDTKLTIQKLRGFARERLAAFKVPSRFWIVQEIPKGAGGKIKRIELATAFSKMRPLAPAEQGLAPRSELERQLATIWADLLDVDRIGIDEDVFALGVDSLTMTTMILHLHECFGVTLSLKDIFDAPTVASLAARLEAFEKDRAAPSSSLSARPTDAAGVTEGRRQQITILQERILRIERTLPGLPQFNVPYAYRLWGPLNIPALEQSLIEIVRRHEVLRTGFTWREELPVAHIMPVDEVKSLLVVEDLAAQVRNSQAKELLLTKAKLIAEKEWLTPIDMKQAPLLRARILRLDVEDHILLLLLHDIIIDRWSMRLFMEEFSEFYRAFALGERPQLPDPPLQFSDFARWQRRWSAGEEASAQLGYWKASLRKATPLFANPDARAELSSRITLKRFYIEKNLLALLRALSHEQGVTLFMTLLAGFKTLLLLRSRRNDIWVATTMANRSQPGTERMIGPLANTTLIRTRLDVDLNFLEALNRVREAVLDAHARQELPFDFIANRLSEEKSLDPTTLVQAYFTFQPAYSQPIKLTKLAVRLFGHRDGQSIMPVDRTWLWMTFKETPSVLAGTCRYKKELFEPKISGNWIEAYRTVLCNAVANPSSPLGQLADAEQ